MPPSLPPISLPPLTLWPRRAIVSRMRTIASIAQELQIPESSARYYRDRFAPWVPTIGEGRGRRYPDAAVPVLRTIAELSRAGWSAPMIEGELQRRGFAIDAQAIQPQQQDAATQQQTAAVELERLIRGAVAAEVAPLREELQAARNEIAQLRAALLLAERARLAPPSPPPEQPQQPQPQPQRPGVVARVLRRLRP